MNQPLTESPPAEDIEICSRVSLLEMRISQYRQRIEMLEATLSATVAKNAAMEKLLEHMQLRIAAAEHHCSSTTDQFKRLEGRIHAETTLRPLIPRLKARLLYPVVSRGMRTLSAVLSVAPNVRDAAAFKLYSSKRHVYNKLKQLSPATFLLIEENTGILAWRSLLDEDLRLKRTTQAEVEPLHKVANTRSAVESNLTLASLPRPKPSVLEAFSAATDKQDERLKEVTRLAQAQVGTTSVAFVVFLQGHDPEQIERTFQSVFRQTDPSWELLLCASNDPQGIVEAWLDRDWRIRRITPQQHEVVALLRSAVSSTSTFIGLLSPGDVVDDDLVKKIGQVASHDAELVAVYTDEASRSHDGNVVDHFYKPGWSPDHQLSVNVLGRFLGIRKQFLLNTPIEAWCKSPVAEYLLTLCLIEKQVRVAHLDEVMYLRDGSKTSDNARVGGRFNAQDIDVARAEMQQRLRQKWDPTAVVESDPNVGALRVRWTLPAEQPVTLVILTNMRYRNVEHRGDILMVLNFVQSIIEKSTYQNYKIIVVDDGDTDTELSDLLEQHGHSRQTYRSQGPFSFSGKSNFASSLVSSGIVVLLNDDLEVIADDWIEALVEQASRPEVGVVGGKLLFPDDSIQHAGICIGLNGSAGHVFMGHPSSKPEYASYASVIRNYGAVTGALMAYRKEVFDAMGGFDEFFRVDYNDIDFCMRCIEKGYRVVFTPYAKLYHFHNSTFNRKHDMKNERAEFLRRWQSWVDLDPYCGIYLTPICREFAHSGD